MPVVPKLTELPSELLDCVLVHIETAQALTRLSITCKGLYAIIEQRGFRLLIQTRFPSIAVPLPADPCANGGDSALHISPKFWKDAAHGLTTLSRNMDRRAFIAQAVQVPENNRNNRVRGNPRRRRRHGPSMGFLPVIDSYEAWHGGDWASRKEVVAWGAGAQLVLRLRVMEPDSREDIRSETSEQGPRVCWQIYSKPGVHEGRDDITALNMLPQSLGNTEELILGRASGSLELIRLDIKSGDEVLATYDTGGMSVRYTTINNRNKTVAATCLGDHTVALYPLKPEERQVRSYASTTVQKVGENARTWSTKFLSEGRLAVGLGRSKQPIHIYDLGQGFQKLGHAIHLEVDGDASLTRSDDVGPNSPGTSIYSIAPLPASSTSSGVEGDVFLSGAYDAHVRYAFLYASTVAT